MSVTKATIAGWKTSGGNMVINVSYEDASGAILDTENHDLGSTGFTGPADFQAAAAAAILSYASGAGYSITAAGINSPIDSLMYAAGVAKYAYVPITAAPAVAGGAGVARFFIDTNGDGTGTAPAEVFAPSVQAVVVNATGAYVMTAVTVDTNRKYIDVTMKALTFSGITVVGIPVLGSQSLVAAANGVVVNCLVFVKK